MLTRDMVEKALPPTLKSAATQQLTDQINNIIADPVVAEQVRNNFISYSSVLKEGRFKTEDYLHAVLYVSYKLMNYSNRDAYQRTFPQRYQNFISKGTPEKDISAYVSMYNKGKLVNLIMEQTLVPSWVLNQDLYQKAINVQADLMYSAKSEIVRQKAAETLIANLAKPKDTIGGLSVNLNETSGMNELKAMLNQLAQEQRAALSSGTSIKELMAQKVIEGEAEDVTR